MSRKKTSKNRRKKGTGTLVLRGSLYQARWTRDGRKFQRSTGTSDRDEALAKLREWTEDFQTEDDAKVLQRLADQIDSTRQSAGAIPLSSLWEKFSTSLRRGECLPHEDRVQKSYVSAFVAWMGKEHPNAHSIRDVTEGVAEKYMATMRDRLSPGTYNKVRNLLSRVWRIATPKGVRLDNPWDEIPKRSPETHRRRELTVEELARVVAPLQGEMRRLFAVGVYTGLRLGDCCNLDWKNIDLVRGFICMVPRKTKRHQTLVKIPIPAMLRSILMETPAQERVGPVLPELRELHARHNTILHTRIRKVFEDAGIQTSVESTRLNRKTKKPRKCVEVGFHSLRHTYVSLCANAGVPLPVVQSIVGHTNPAMTTHYFHVADTALEEAAHALPAIEPGYVPITALPAPSENLRRAREAIAALTAEEKDEIRRMLDTGAHPAWAS